MWQIISRKLLKWWGWELQPEQAQAPKKYVLIVVPHTSSWDFPVGLLARAAFGLEVFFVGKKSLFRPPFGWIFRALGGMPVDRSKRTNMVDTIVGMFHAREEFAICIAPEGTRRRVDKLRTGFYYISLKARVPIILVQFNWKDKIININEPFHPSGDYERDFNHINNHFKGILGKNEENSFFPNG